MITLICTGICALLVECTVKLNDAEGYFLKGVQSVTKDAETTEILKGVFRAAPASDRADKAVSRALTVLKIEDNRPKSRNRNFFEAMGKGFTNMYNSIAGFICNIGVEKLDCDAICICKRNPIKPRPDCPPRCPILPKDRKDCAKQPACPANCYLTDSKRSIGIDEVNDDDDSSSEAESPRKNSGHHRSHYHYSSMSRTEKKSRRAKKIQRHHHHEDDDDDDHDHWRSKRDVRGDIANPFGLRGVETYNKLVSDLKEEERNALKDVLEVFPEDGNLDFLGDVLSALDRFNDNMPQFVIKKYEKAKERALMNSTHHGKGRSFMAGLTTGFSTNLGSAVQGQAIQGLVGVAGDALKEGVKGVVGDICGGYRLDKCDCKQKKYECKLPPVDQVCDSTICPNYRGCPIFGCKCTNVDFQQMYNALQ